MLSLDVDQVIEANKRREEEEMVQDWLNDDRRMGLFSQRTSGAILKRNDIILRHPKATSPWKNYNTNHNKWF
jgi:hypothetical protein